MSQQSALILKNFLRNHKVTISEFAKVTDVSRFSIYRYLAGGPIQRKIAKKIEEKVLQTYRIHIPFEKLID